MVIKPVALINEIFIMININTNSINTVLDIPIYKNEVNYKYINILFINICKNICKNKTYKD